ncbi:DUF882 domain-containing protein [Afipia clevelandensis]|uniref:Murein endopeptidase K n=1 Tax=Afipia clevelandensis ATCC 49720 TaxID=883079 RepID=K8P6H6_9BRAD|nr:DUF882 domain-containing protein [Afipia clevelandensis]EGP09949.1 protein of unknown function DUF882 [Bradyrhizobiaceae bacterium SG-6C]EKS35225.1 hypothetical protein HMPREF9696_02497 [Afipia clevelandensis ATCC 49720]
MAGGFPRSIGFDWLSRTSVRVSLASLLLIATNARSVHNATADGDTRSLSFHHTHSGEDLTVTFKRNGRYDEAALKKLNYFLRDWRSQDQTTMDRRLFDIIWEVYRDVDGKQPIQIISAYRSPATNAMLRRRSSGVARHSQHMQGHAMDFFIPGVPLEQIRFAGLRLQRGGVGFYPTSGSPFVHLDVGSIRHWPRMTHDQLARVFPDGRTVHVPSDGKPLKNYELALADIQRRGNGEDVAAPSKSKSFLASLFGRKSADDEEEVGNDDVRGGKVTQVAMAVADKTKTAAQATVNAAEKVLERVPLPRAKPAGATTYQVASAEPRSIPAPKPQQAALRPMPADEYAPQSPIDVINARGFWDNEPATKPAAQAQIAALKARGAIVAADPQATASLPPNVSQALAYAPAETPLDQAKVVAASAPLPRSPRVAALASNPMSGSDASGGSKTGAVTTARRIKQAFMNDLWLRAMVLAPSVSYSLSASILGDQDMTVLRTHFVKPNTAVAMTFSNDPQMGIVCEKFTGPATATLSTTAFAMRTASLR